MKFKEWVYALLFPQEATDRTRQLHTLISNQKQAIVELQRYQKLADAAKKKQSDVDGLAEDYEHFFRS